jgi:hypothetical protein
MLEGTESTLLLFVFFYGGYKAAPMLLYLEKYPPWKGAVKRRFD